MNGKFLANYENFPDNDKQSFHLSAADQSEHISGKRKYVAGGPLFYLENSHQTIINVK
jgi:hypothetical protein